LLVHRLDMATSGLLLVARNAAAHKHLQQQFIRRTIKKRYVAVLSALIEQQNRRIKLPLRVDLNDRPRQMVCHQYGKPSITDVRLISTDGNTSRVYFYPLTGRTHQLRVHAAHALGLAAPIVGDALYGTPQQRLLLHAERLVFEHPQTAQIITVVSEVPF
jgi:tRNA pseudouridine32 synthase/23S rRNA pseudouridine746 synthase